MLAQNFKTHNELGIREIEHRALVTVLGMLERGELKHVRVPENPITFHPQLHPKFRKLGFFNMDWWGNQFECGSVCCIGGSAEIIMGEHFRIASYELHDLFHPPGTSYDDITPAQAAVVLRGYLTTGKTKWFEVGK